MMDRSASINFSSTKSWSSLDEVMEGNHFTVVLLASRGYFSPPFAVALFRFLSALVVGGSWLKARALPSLLVLAMSAAAARSMRVA